MNAKMHRIHMPNVGEGVLYHGGGEPYQYDDEEKYPVGAYVRFGNKGFVYAESGGIVQLQHGAKPKGIRQPVGWSAIKETVPAGVKQITVQLDGSAGPGGDGNITKDYLKGGEVCLMPVWGTGFTRHITGNSAIATSSGGEFTIDFDAPTPIILTLDISHAEAIPSLYRGVVAEATPGDQYAPVVGMPTIVAADGKFCWLQVEGPFGIAAQGDVGHAGKDLQAVFRSDGSIGPHIDDDVEEEQAQHAGVIMFMGLTDGQGCPFVNLQIAH